MIRAYSQGGCNLPNWPARESACDPDKELHSGPSCKLTYHKILLSCMWQISRNPSSHQHVKFLKQAKKMKESSLNVANTQEFDQIAQVNSGNSFVV